jgi:hypothetical protein
MRAGGSANTVDANAIAANAITRRRAASERALDLAGIATCAAPQWPIRALRSIASPLFPIMSVRPSKRS